MQAGGQLRSGPALNAGQDRTSGGGYLPSARTSLDERYFRRIDKFNNKESTWKEWRVHFVSSIREASPELAGWMAQAEGVSETITAESA